MRDLWEAGLPPLVAGVVLLGKTLSLVRMAKSYADRGYKIFSNITLIGIKYEKLTLKKLLNYAENEEQFKDAFFIIDEFAIFVGDSRRAMSTRNLAISYFIVMSRKLNICIGLTVQVFGMIEKRVRQNTDILIECKTMKLPSGELLVKNVWNSSTGKVKTNHFIGNEWFKWYDTYEIVNYELEE